jgi:hypothetical protein
MPIGEEVFTVSGTAPPDAKACEAFLRSAAGDEVPNTRRRVSAGRFQTDFPVMTCGEDYSIVVWCDGAERTIVTGTRLHEPLGMRHCGG